MWNWTGNTLCVTYKGCGSLWLKRPVDDYFTRGSTSCHVLLKAEHKRVMQCHHHWSNLPTGSSIYSHTDITMASQQSDRAEKSGLFHLKALQSAHRATEHHQSE